jgi:ATP-dependent DNA ligase
MLTRHPTRAVTLCAFDVLWFDGIDCTQLAYRERRRVLGHSANHWLTTCASTQELHRLSAFRCGGDG